MYKTLFILFLVVCSSFCPVSNTDQVVMAAAESQLPAFLAKIPAGRAAAYGISPQDDLDLYAIGRPCRTLQFSSDFYTDATPDESKNYIVVKNEWRVPVSIRGVNRTLLTVTGNTGNYIISGMGDTTLAQELQQQNEGMNDTDGYYILRVPRLRADFLAAESNNSFYETRFTPLPTAITAMPSLFSAGKAVFTLLEVETAVKEALGKPALNVPKAR